MRRLIAFVILASAAVAPLLATGCGAASPQSARDGMIGDDERQAARAMEGREKGKKEAAPHAPAAGGQAGELRKEAEAAEPERKIIYTGKISLVVEDFDKAETLLTGLLKEHGGYVATSAVNAQPHQARSGNWTVRVPVAHSDDFRKEIAKLGELRSSTLDSRDVTDEYHDTKNTIKNLEARQEKLREMYKDKKLVAGLQQVLELDRELTSVSTQIDVRKGQVQRWDKETAYATYTVTIYDRRGYVPPESPEFTTTIGRTWSGSVDGLISFGRGIVLVVVALTPWLPVIALIVVPAFLLIRRGLRGIAAAANASVQHDREPRRPRREEDRHPDDRRRPPLPLPRRQADAGVPVVEAVDAQPAAEQKAPQPRREGPEGD